MRNFGMRLECENIVCIIDEALSILGERNEAWWRGFNLTAVKLYCSLLND